MKYICLGYMEANKFETMSESERNAFVDGCFAYDDVLRGLGKRDILQGPTRRAFREEETGMRMKIGFFVPAGASPRAVKESGAKADRAAPRT
jgi:hypothetical protein